MKRFLLADRRPRLIIVILLAAIFLIPGLGVWTVVDAGHVGVVTRFGAVNRVVSPGLVLKIPVFEGVSSMETRTQKEQIDALAASKDLQRVTATIALNFHLRGEKAVEVYQNIGTDYVNIIIAPAMQEAFKSTTSQFTAPDLIVQREKIRQLAFDELRDRLAKYDIVADDFNIVNFAFSDEFRNAVEQKNIAEQNKEKAQVDAQTAVIQAKNKAETDLIQAQSQAQIALIQAKGQADAQKALKDAGSLSAAYLQFLAIQKWDGKLPVSTNGATPFFQLPTQSQ